MFHADVDVDVVVVFQFVCNVNWQMGQCHAMPLTRIVFLRNNKQTALDNQIYIKGCIGNHVFLVK